VVLPGMTTKLRFRNMYVLFAGNHLGPRSESNSRSSAMWVFVERCVSPLPCGACNCTRVLSVGCTLALSRVRGNLELCGREGVTSRASCNGILCACAVHADSAAPSPPPDPPFPIPPHPLGCSFLRCLVCSSSVPPMHQRPSGHSTHVS
jgi:hypothetical protein